MKKCTSETTSKLDRKTAERNRRIQMKGLCFKLASMVPPQHCKSSKSKEMMTQQSQLDLAASYIKQLTERIEILKERKEKELSSQLGTSNKPSMNDVNNRACKTAVAGSRLPLIKMSELGSSIEVLLISGLNKNFMFYEVITVLQEEGAEVVSANFSTVGNKVFHTIHAQVKISRVGVETTRVWQRLQDLIY
ncbi:transcription factor bHLH162-like [Argentina anserina]|uniref:transcription factor bHLH162-like n=1 Tax=Argentina anserina TaxID=57926 RepID=UPI0021768057|nr:transcription factor bHLH162-like [Potentilla anserina]